jgi:hypothetical protein
MGRKSVEKQMRAIYLVKSRGFETTSTLFIKKIKLKSALNIELDKTKQYATKLISETVCKICPFCNRFYQITITLFIFWSL